MRKGRSFAKRHQPYHIDRITRVCSSNTPNTLSFGELGQRHRPEESAKRGDDVKALRRRLVAVGVNVTRALHRDERERLRDENEVARPAAGKHRALFLALFNKMTNIVVFIVCKMTKLYDFADCKMTTLLL